MYNNPDTRKSWASVFDNSIESNYKNWSIKKGLFDENCTKKGALGLVLSIPIGIPLPPDWFVQAASSAMVQDRFPVNIKHKIRI